MQTKQQIERLLAYAGVTPNKRLGQHFLIDLNLMRSLIDAAHIRFGDIVLEVGCGTGSFTEALAEAAGQVIAVEYDDTLAQIAAKQLKRKDNVTIISSDILESKNTLCREVADALETAASQWSGRFMLIANLPYSVAAAVMANLITGPIVCDSMYVTVQKEVAERMVATTGGKDYGVLGIFAAATGQAKILRKLKPSVFWPQPQVESAMLTFRRQPKKAEQIHNMDFFKEIVNLFMGHRRKMLKACVKFSEGRLEKIHNWNDIFNRAVIDPQLRPEEITAENYIAIANLCYRQIH